MSKETAKFSQTGVRNIKPPKGKADHIVWDQDMPGFGIRFRNGGPGVYIIAYFVNGRPGRITLGAVAKVTLDDAQTRARAHFNLIADDINPVVEKAKIAAKMILFKSKVDEYIAYLGELGRTKKYIGDNKRTLGGDFGTDAEVTGYCSGLYKFAFPELNLTLVAAELDAIEKDHGTGAMRDCRSHLNAYLAWARQKGLLDAHPGDATRKPPTIKRDRILRAENELPVVYKLLDPTDDFGAIGKLLWLTWARRDEIAQLRKNEVDRDRRLIHLVGKPTKSCAEGRTKNGNDLVIPLSKQAWAVLEPKLDQRKDSEFVFGSGAGGFSGWDRATNRLRDASGLDHYTLHDFRRTGRSLGVRRPVSILPHIAEAILNHISTAESGKQGVAGVYDVNDPWQYHEEKAEALQKWADYISELTRPQLKQVA